MKLREKAFCALKSNTCNRSDIQYACVHWPVLRNPPQSAVVDSDPCPALRVPRVALQIKWDTNAIYFGGGLALYTMHVMSRLTAWKRSARVVLNLIFFISRPFHNQFVQIFG